MTIDTIIDFWYSERVKKQWFNSTKALDDEIGEKFESVWQLACNDELTSWSDSAPGCLALAIIFDQFTLNMYRGTKKAFASEAKAIAISHLAINHGFADAIPKPQLSFLFMPLMHSEELADQKLSIKMFEKYQLTQNIRFAHHHHDLIKRFGRFPHRNIILGRQSSQKEQEYLNSPGAFLG